MRLMRGGEVVMLCVCADVQLEASPQSLRTDLESLMVPSSKDYLSDTPAQLLQSLETNETVVGAGS
jgi:hypothetical protein